MYSNYNKSLFWSSGFFKTSCMSHHMMCCWGIPLPPSQKKQLDLRICLPRVLIPRLVLHPLGLTFLLLNVKGSKRDSNHRSREWTPPPKESCKTKGIEKNACMWFRYVTFSKEKVPWGVFVLKRSLFISRHIKYPLICTHILGGSLASVTIPVKTVSA